MKAIVIEGLSRLARNLYVQEAILRDLQANGVELISVQEPDLGKRDPARERFRQIMGEFAEYKKQMIVLKLRAARERKRAATGRCP